MDPEFAPRTLPFTGDAQLLPITPITPAPLLDLGFGTATPEAEPTLAPPPNYSAPQLASASRALKVTPFGFAPYIDSLWPRPEANALELFTLHLELYQQVKKTCLPNYLQARIPIPSQMNCDAWDEALVGYWDAQVATFLRYGWPGSYTAPLPPTPSQKNHPSAEIHADDVGAFLSKEVELGAMLGPFEAPPFEDWFQTSPLMTRPLKK